MPFSALFINSHGRMRSGWRLAVFISAFLISFFTIFSILNIALVSLLRYSPEGVQQLFGSSAAFVIQSLIITLAATTIGWGCGYALEGLPFRALGWAFHRGWVRDLLFGSLIGSLSMIIAAGLAGLGGGFHFTASSPELLPAVIRTLLVSGSVFILAAAAEEVLFRGYPLQTLLRSLPPWVAFLPSAVIFSAVHLSNPNVARGWTFVNTVLAGIWLSVAYLRTRSLWFPLGVHWAWNWTMGSVLGLPVSGITELTPAPLLRVADAGPDWLTGGSYGIEGGFACTLTLALSTLFLWRTRLLSATEEMLALTNSEKPEDPLVDQPEKTL